MEVKDDLSGELRGARESLVAHCFRIQRPSSRHLRRLALFSARASTAPVAAAAAAAVGLRVAVGVPEADAEAQMLTALVSWR